MNHEEIKEKLFDKLDKNLDDFLIGWEEETDNSQLIEKSEEISATKMVYSSLKSDRYNTDYLEYLLKFENPLAVVRDKCLSDNAGFFNQNLDHVLWDLTDKQDAEMDYELDPQYASNGLDKGMEMQ